MKKHIANMLSLLNFSLGFLSIFFSIQGSFLYAAYFVVLAAAIDAIDGTVSRIMKINTPFGKQLDNTSDLVSFAIAPAVFSYLTLSFDFPFNYIFPALLLVFVVSGLIRTARLNSGETTKWHGMMITFNVAIPLLYILNLFSVYTISGWLLISPIFMLSKFSLRDSFKRKKKEKTVELKSEDAEKEEKKDKNLIPLSIFGD